MPHTGNTTISHGVRRLDGLRDRSMMPYDGADAGARADALAVSRRGNGQSNEMHSLLVVLFVLGAASQSPPPRYAASWSIPPARRSPGATVAVDSGDGSAGHHRSRRALRDHVGRAGLSGGSRSRSPGFQSSDATIVVPAPGRRARRRGELRITLLPRALGETVSVTATRGSERLEGAAPVSVVTPADLQLAASPALDDALRSVPGFSLFRRTSSRTANPTAQGASLRGRVGLRCEPRAGAGRRRAAQRPVRRMGVLGPRAAGGHRARRGRARRRERLVRRRRALGCRAGADAAAAWTVRERHNRGRLARDAARVGVRRHGRARVDGVGCGRGEPDRWHVRDRARGSRQRRRARGQRLPERAGRRGRRAPVGMVAARARRRSRGEP